MPESFRGDVGRHHIRGRALSIQQGETGQAPSSEALRSMRHALSALPQQGHWYRGQRARNCILRVPRSGQGAVSSDCGGWRSLCAGEGGAKSAHEWVRRLHIETPIIDQAYAVLYEGKPPAQALEELLG